MDNAQIKLYVETHISSEENLADPRVSLELNRFITALCEQEKHLQRQPTPQQVDQAWANWKLEHFQYIENVRAHNEERRATLRRMAQLWLAKNEHALHNDEHIAHEASTFVDTFSLKQQDLRLDPLPEHIALAWNAWKKGYRW